jgi:hypothetical protein
MQPPRIAAVQPGASIRLIFARGALGDRARGAGIEPVLLCLDREGGAELQVRARRDSQQRAELLPGLVLGDTLQVKIMAGLSQAA